MFRLVGKGAANDERGSRGQGLASRYASGKEQICYREEQTFCSLKMISVEYKND